MKQSYIIIFAFLFGFLESHGQEEKIKTNKGNEKMDEGLIQEAQEAYLEALEINPEYKEAQFNLGNLYQSIAREIISNASETENQEEQQKLLEEARKYSKQAAAQFDKLSQEISDPTEINKTQYNLGNAHLLSGEVDKSIDSFKEALRQNPTDEDARYNLAYAQHLKKQQEQQKQDQDQEQKQDQQQEEQEQDQEQQENKNEQSKDQKENQQQQQQEISEEEAQKMLEALMKQEKDLQEKLKKKRHKAQRVKIEKDW